MNAVTVGVDVGGTFTDVVVDDGHGGTHVTKVLTTPDDPLRGVRRGIRQALERAGVRGEQVRRVVHGTTLATNVILQRRGAAVAFVTTEGFGDLFRLGREARVEEDRYDLAFAPLRPPLSHALTFEAPERMRVDGTALRPLAVADADAVAARVAAARPEAVAVCLLNAWADPAHEQLLAERLRAALPEVFVATSAEVWPELREYERGMTTLLSAYVGPVMSRYLNRLRAMLTELGVPCGVHVMDSAGGVMSAGLAAERPILTVESGGAAGVVAAGQVGDAAGHEKVLSFDMGGTTAKLGLVHGGRPTVTHSFEVSGKGSFGVARLGSGLPVKTPVVDLAEVGAGGGSIAWVDGTGALRVGPHSAGADPGPVCYGLGGSEPTVTDANLLLGYLDPAGLADGVRLDRDAATDAIRRRVAEPLGMDPVQAAQAIHDIAVATMAAAIRVVTVQRGEDPREFTMVAFGGAGPMFAARLAEGFGIRDILVPATAGVASAAGLLHADLSVERVRTKVLTTSAVGAAELTALFDEVRTQALAELGVDDPEVATRLSVDVRYRGQAHQLTVPTSAEELSEPGLAGLLARFQELYRATYGVAHDAPTQLVTYRVRVTRGFGAQPRVHAPVEGADAAAVGHRTAYFRELGRHVEAPVHRYERLAPGATISGPAFVDSAESTTLLPPGYRATVTGAGDLRLAPVDATGGRR